MFRILIIAVIGLGLSAAADDSAATAPPASEPTIQAHAAAALSDETDGQLALRYAPESPAERRWFIHAGLINAYPKLESEELIDIFNVVVRALAPGFDDVTTVSDYRDAHLLWQPQIGFGYKINDRWSFAAQAGVAWGTVRTEAEDMTWLLVPLHTDFSITRGAWFFGAGFDYFPFKMAEQRPYDGFWDRVKGTRPYIGGSMTVTKAWFEAKVKLGVPVLPNLAVTLEDDWFITSFNLHLGLDVPITKDGGLAINYGRNFFLEQEFDFEGTALSVEWKQFFTAPRRAL